MTKTIASQGFRNAVAEIFISKTAMNTRWVSSPRVAQAMTDSEWRAYSAAFDNKLMRLVVRLYWLVYRFERWRGAIPAASDEPWN